VRNKYVLGLYL